MALIPGPTKSVIKAKIASWYDGTIGWKRPPQAEFRPFIVTGPPRSGTSLMNVLLGRKPNVIVVNEPLEMMPRMLLRSRTTRRIQGFINRTARRAFERGEVMNKVDSSDPNRPSSDTFNKGARWRALKVEIDPKTPLCVAAKATMPFMDSLETVCTQWPDLRVLIMLRDPGPTIRSWKQTFGWQPGLDRVGAGFQFALYDRVDRAGEALHRRARLWRVLAEEAMRLAASQPSQIKIVRYERLLEDPAATMSEIFAHIRAVDPQVAIDVSDVRPQDRPKYVGFSDTEVSIIEKECQKTTLRLAELA